MVCTLVYIAEVRRRALGWEDGVLGVGGGRARGKRQTKQYSVMLN